ncbi:hypothetical protein Dimus_010875, partial [Dionaea muscipula]
MGVAVVEIEKVEKAKGKVVTVAPQLVPEAEFQQKLEVEGRSKKNKDKGKKGDGRSEKGK